LDPTPGSRPDVVEARTRATALRLTLAAEDRGGEPVAAVVGQPHCLSASSTFMIPTTGPKDSSRMIFIEWSTRIVGGYQSPRPRGASGEDGRSGALGVST
jgi:hypothetical protein